MYSYIACGRIVDVQKCQLKNILCNRLVKLKRDWAWTVVIVDMKQLQSCPIWTRPRWLYERLTQCSTHSSKNNTIKPHFLLIVSLDNKI